MASELNLDIALGTVEAMLKVAREHGLRFSAAVVDAGGELIAMSRMDGASPNSARMCINKAYTAVKWLQDTRTLKEKLFDYRLGEERRDIAWFCDSKYTAVWGGVVLRRSDGTVIGAIGGSGGTAMEDEEIARVGADWFACAP